MTESFPLYWPEGRPRTEYPAFSNFKTLPGIARDGLFNELNLLKATGIILSTNVPLRLDGLPYAQQRNITDPGVAAYFTYRNRQMCFACDRWNSVRDNTQAVRKTIQALRGIARWGTGDMMAAAFAGFEALPAPTWRDDLGLTPDSTLADAELSYHKRARTAHPDQGGSGDMMSRLNTAISEARANLAA